jgi:dephospho-CoA kinase
LEEFKNMIDRELGKGEKTSGLQLEKCYKLSDVVIENDSSIQALRKKIDEVISA